MKKTLTQKVEEIMLKMCRQGYRRSASRGVILRALGESKNPLSIQDILMKTQKAGRAFNKTTIYREIALLQSLGYVKELRLRNDTALYEMDMSHHHHLTCTECGDVRHIALKESLREEEDRIAKKEKFVIREHMLEFFGVCRKCQ